MTAADGMPRPALRAYEVVLDWVETRILNGELAVGDLLPAERDLASRLEVSRSAVREAVRTLQAQGVLRSSVGAGAAGGTTVTAVPRGALSRLLRLHVALANFPLEDVVEVRITLERLSSALAASHARAGDLESMTQAHERMLKEEHDRSAFNDADTDFHVAIALAAGNRLATDLTVAIRESMRSPILERAASAADWAAVREQLCRDHAAILAAIEAGDAAGASDRNEKHIRGAWRMLASGDAVAARISR